jgi:DNA-binding transcriptional LysR family regulator
MKSPRAPSSAEQLDLNLLNVFHVVYRERSVNRAARILGLTQSAVSHSIGRLRTRVGAALFEVRGGGLVPTATANRMAPGIEAALKSMQLSVLTAREFDPRRDVARVTLAMQGLFEPLLLPNIVSSLRRAAPWIVVRSVRLDRAKAKRYLGTGLIDVAFDTLEPSDPDLSCERLLEDTLCVVHSRDRIEPVDREAYLAAKHVGVSSRASGPTLMDMMLIRQGLRRSVVVRCQRYESAVAIVASSDLLLTMPRAHAHLVSPSTPVVVQPLEMGIPPLRIHLYWHRHRDEDPALLWIRNFMQPGFVKFAEARSVKADPT